MTAQVGEALIYNGKTYEMFNVFCLPNDGRIEKLEEFNADSMEDYIIGSTANWRQYIGTWGITDDKLFLKHLRGYFRMCQNEPLWADWVSDTLVLPHGKLLEYHHMGFASRYQFETHIEIKNGHVISFKEIENTPDGRINSLGD